MTLPPSPQHVALANMFDDDRLDSVAEFAEKQISLWISVREGAIRRERETIETHCRQISILTKATFETVRALRVDPGEKAGAA
jgi:hypothetical protein